MSPCSAAFFIHSAASATSAVSPTPACKQAASRVCARASPRAAAIYETIGCYLGYAIAHYADYYDIANLLILGRVTSGEGGHIIINEAETVLAHEFPDLPIKLVVPDENTKRLGQAVAAASLPALPPGDHRATGI